MYRLTMAVVGLVFISAGTLAAAPQGPSMEAEALQGWTIVVSPDAIASEAYAAREFQKLFKDISGVELAIVESPKDATKNIFIAPGETLKASAVAIATDDLGEEGLRIRIEKDNLAIAGGRPRGTLYGVYEFFERYFGVRFLTFDHTYIPQEAAAAVLPCETYSYVPPFEFRWSYYYETAAQKAFAARLRNNTVTDQPELGGATPQALIGHSFQGQLPTATYGTDHPEYFLMIDGKRRPDIRDAWGPGPNPCYAQPAVLDIVSNAVLGYFRSHPEARNVSVSCTDTALHCQCPECAAINEREGCPTGSHLDFVNKVAERVAAEFPGKKVGTLAYYHTRKPPKSIKPRDNVQIQLCSIECCTRHALDDPECPKNMEFYQDLKGWGEISDQVWIWNYNTNFHCYGLPFPNLRSIGPNVRLFRDNHVKGVFMQAAGNGNSSEFSDLRNYVISRCLWKPGRDSWREALAFCKMHYGRAAAPIIEWLTLFHNHCELSDVHFHCFPKAADMNLTPELAVKCHQLFQQALAMAENDTIRKRVEKASIASYVALLEAAPWELRDGAYRLAFPKEVGDSLARYEELAARYGVNMATERETVADYLAQYQPRPVLELSNAVWDLRVMPAANGKVVRWLHKPSGRQLVVGEVGRHVRGAFDEWVPVGCSREEAQNLAYDGKLNAGAIELTKRLGNGGVLVRTLWLDEKEPNALFCKTVCRNEGSEPQTYQFRVHPQFDAATTEFKQLKLTRYLQDRWQDVVPANLPDSRLVEPVVAPEDHWYAFFNHTAGFGVRISYDPNQIADRYVWTAPQWRQINLELVTKTVSLKPGESTSFEYRFDYLSAPPK